MFSIGEFSRVSRLSVKTLRYYHDRGLLIPARVESGSGYRYYDEANVDKARAIVALRSLQFSLDQINQILEQCDDDSHVFDFLVEQRDKVGLEILRQTDIASRLDKIIQSENHLRKVMNKPNESVIVKQVENLLVAGIRIKGKYSDCGDGFTKLGKQVGRFISGKAFCLFYDEGYREKDADFETCFPISKQVQQSGINVHELPGGRFLSAIHRGPYDQVGPTYQRLIEYAKINGLELKAPCREIYIKGPGMIFNGNPKKYVTEIQMPVVE